MILKKRKTSSSLSAVPVVSKQVMVFGVFDRIHPGHCHFLETASKLGDRVVVVIARDSSVLTLKQKKPVESEEKRLQKVQKLAFVAEVVLGDEQIGSYNIIKLYQPDLICLGYDQTTLERDLNNKMRQGMIQKTVLVRLEAHQPEIFHSSLIPPADLS
jgi:cytidyltransferase-like protein